MYIITVNTFYFFLIFILTWLTLSISTKCQLSTKRIMNKMNNNESPVSWRHVKSVRRSGRYTQDPCHPGGSSAV